MSRSKKVGITAMFGLGILYVTSTRFTCFQSFLKSALSCTVASIARLAYTVEFLKEDKIGDYASNFDSMSLFHL